MDDNKKLDDLLKKKKQKKDDKAVKDTDLKSKMFRVIEAQKKLDSDILAGDPEKNKIREKLASASKVEEMTNMKDKNEERKRKLEEINNTLDNINKDSKVVKKESKDIASVLSNKKKGNSSVLFKTEVINKNDEANTISIIKNEKPKKEEKKENISEVKEEVTKDTKPKKKPKVIIPDLKEEKVNSKKTLKRFWSYVIKTMNGMAFGLFATLIVGTILATIAGFFKSGTLINTNLTALANGLKGFTGVGIGLGIAWALNYKGLKLISIGVAGGIVTYLSGTPGFKIGDPLSVYLIVVVTSLLMDLVFKKKTPVDIIIIPLFVALLSGALTILVSEYIAYATTGIGKYIGIATKYQPIVMGIVIAVIMGMALTAPISSAAIAATILTQAAFISNPAVAIAGGAAVIGCSTQMIGFAIHSRKDNNIGTVLAIFFGTSMLQFKNILRKPVIWVPTILTSAILGPIATKLLEVKVVGTAAGMGTSGLVGQIGIINQMGSNTKAWLVVGFSIIAPLILVFIIDIVFRKLKIIKKGDFKI